MGEIIEQAIRLGFGNNESEYEAILAGIKLVVTMSANRLLIQSDFQLVVGRVNKEYESQDPQMEKYVSLVKQRLNGFSAWNLSISPEIAMRKRMPWPPLSLHFQ